MSGFFYNFVQKASEKLLYKFLRNGKHIYTKYPVRIFRNIE